MSVAGLLTPQSATAGYNPSPVISTNAETFGATVDFMRTNMNIDASLRLTGNAYRDRDESIRREFGQDPLDITGIKKKYTNPTAEGRVKMLQENQKLLDNWIMQGRKDNPDKFGKIKTSAEVEESAREVARVSKRQYEDILSRNPNSFGRTAASLGGGIAGGLTDPLNIATMAFGAGAGKTILQAALIEGSINAATELASQPFVSQWQKELGHKYGLGDMAGNVAFAFAGGAAFTTVARGLVPAVRKSYEVAGSVSQRVLDRIAESERLPASVRNAAAYMSRVAHIDESAPPGTIKTELDLSRHRKTVNNMAEKFEGFKAPEAATARPFNFPIASEAKKFVDKSPNELTFRDYEVLGENPLGANFVQELEGRGIPVRGETVDSLDKQIREVFGDEIVDINQKVKAAHSKIDEYTGGVRSFYGQPAENVYMKVTQEAAYRGDPLPPDVLTVRPEFEKELKDGIQRMKNLKDKGPPDKVIKNMEKTLKDVQKGKYGEPGRRLDIQDADRMSENVKPIRQASVDIKDMDRLTSKRATFDQIMAEDPNLKVTLEDGSQVTLKELAKTVDDDLAVIEAMTSCRIG